MAQIQESASLFEVNVPEFKLLKQCRKELKLLKVCSIIKLKKINKYKIKMYLCISSNFGIMFI